MTEPKPTWNLTEEQWRAIQDRAELTADALEDGAYVRSAAGEGGEMEELHFYATGLNKPDDWRFPFAEDIPGSSAAGAFIGRAWHDPATGFVHFEVVVYAAAQAVRADYESGVGDLDYVTYEQEVERAIAGTQADKAWLAHEFGRLANIAVR